jgi:hypothetical protein
MKRLTALVVAIALLLGLGLSTTAQSAGATTVPRTTAQKVAYIINLYDTYVVKDERAHLANHYRVQYNTFRCNGGNDAGCTWNKGGGQVVTSFQPVFFTYTAAAQRNIVAHEAAHAFGFLHIVNYTTPSWAGQSALWQRQFHALDRGFARTYDAEAYAACVAWKETGINVTLVQTKAPCSQAAAALALKHI